MRAPSISMCQVGSAQNMMCKQAPHASGCSIESTHIPTTCGSMGFTNITSQLRLAITGSTWLASRISGVASVTTESHYRTMAPRPWMRGSITLILSISRKERGVKTGGSRLHRSRGTRWIIPRMLRHRRLTTVGRLQRLASGNASIPRHDIPGTLNPGILASRNIIRIFCNIWFIGIIKTMFLQVWKRHGIIQSHSIIWC